MKKSLLTVLNDIIAINFTTARKEKPESSAKENRGGLNDTKTIIKRANRMPITFEEFKRKELKKSEV